ncbi:MAG TPA: DinB family protein [Patescibacteria group bacterium]|nr:DinB family protein [Patescibacteria group bacterium]
MSDDRRFIIAQKDGMTPLVSHIFTMLEYARQTTLDTVRNLSIEQLDHMHDEKSNSIGTLLHHMAAVEVWYQVFTFEDRDWFHDEAEAAEWGDALELNAKAKEIAHGKPLEYYVGKLNAVRQKTLEGFKKRNDAWLMEERPFLKEIPANFYFMWFHVAEDEINHRGQIRWLRKRLPNFT